MAPDAGGVPPDGGGMAPDGGGVAPDGGGMAPDGGGVPPDLGFASPAAFQRDDHRQAAGTKALATAAAGKAGVHATIGDVLKRHLQTGPWSLNVIVDVIGDGDGDGEALTSPSPSTTASDDDHVTSAAMREGPIESRAPCYGERPIPGPVAARGPFG